MNKHLSFCLVAAVALLCIIPNIGSGQSSRKGYLGIYSQSLSREVIKRYNLPVEHGAYVTGTVDGSPAEDAGIKRRDVIVKVGGETIYDDGDLTDAIRSTKPGTDVPIELYRDGEKKVITAKVGKVKSYGYTFNSNSFSNSFGQSFRSFFSHDFQSPNRGVDVENLTRQLGDYFGVSGGRGVLITDVRKGGVVDKAGFKAGDVITKVDSRDVDDTDDLQDVVNDREGKTVDVQIMRSSKQMTLSIKIPDEDEDWY